jgi:hypothetical protein
MPLTDEKSGFFEKPDFWHPLTLLKLRLQLVSRFTIPNLRNLVKLLNYRQLCLMFFCEAFPCNAYDTAYLTPRYGDCPNDRP